MNTKKLKNFAQVTRRKLLKQVEAKLEHVLEADTGALREKASLINALKKDLEQYGREPLIEKIAYTWFNRFAALRYMDARGFQPLNISVLSPEEGQVSPQLLQEAMGGHIPAELKVDPQQVMDILDGRTGSSNPENEAYRLLLIGVCNHLHEIFPFLFEPIDDYTELLLPDDLTSEFSVIRDVVDGMAAEDCQQVEVMGWLYQFYISEKKDEVFASKGKVKKEEIPAVTQLFTPRWIVEYMVQNTVGKMWVLNHPNSRLKEHMPYYIESEVEAEDVLTIESPEELTLLDQACGSGHILVYGFELLYKIYEEEGYAPSDIPRLIMEHNLHGFEIDERAAQLAGIAVLMKAREYQRRLFRKAEVPVPNITCFEDLRLTEKEIKETLNHAGVEITDELLHDLTTMQQATNFGSLIAPHSSVSELKKAKIQSKEKLDGADLFEKENIEQLVGAIATLEKLGVKVSCVVDNPPYMGSRNMNKELSNFVKANYPDSKSDLMTCFMEAGWSSLKNKGVIGMINLPSWLFNSSFEKLREKLNAEMQIDSLLHMGRGIFGVDWGSTSFVIINSYPKVSGKYFKLHKRNFQHLYPDDIASIFLEAKDSPDVKVDFERYREGEKLNSVSDLFGEKGQKVSYESIQSNFKKVPGSPVGYWLSDSVISAFKGTSIGDLAPVRKGNSTSDNNRFLRFGFEIKLQNQSKRNESIKEALSEQRYWIPYNKGGAFRKWYGNQEYLVFWKNEGKTIRDIETSVVTNEKFYMKPGLTWSTVTANKFSLRWFEEGFIFDNGGCCLFEADPEKRKYILAVMNSKVFEHIIGGLNPTLNFQSGEVSKFPIIFDSEELVQPISKNCIDIAKEDWNKSETSWDFQQNELNRFNSEGGIENLEESYDLYQQYWTNKFFQLHQNEEELNRQFIDIYGLQEELTPDVPLNEITILQDELETKKLKEQDAELRRQKAEDGNPELPFKDKEVFSQFVSYAVGCMFGRYSLDKKGLILANQGETLQDYLSKVEKSESEVSFLPDDDNIIPVLDDEWFEDDIVFRFHQFLKVSFGEAHFQKNLAFVEEHITHGDLRKYFDKSFYKDHYKRYSKRPIYWKFSSPKGHFSVLIYMHRYTPDTLNNILNNYLRAFIEKLETRKEQMQQLQNTGSTGEKARASKEIDKLKAMIKDCKTYEREILYPLASERIAMDLDDGVLVNYNLFGKAVEQIKSVNDKKKKKKVAEFDWIDGSRIR